MRNLTKLALLFSFLLTVNAYALKEVISRQVKIPSDPSERFVPRSIILSATLGIPKNKNRIRVSDKTKLNYAFEEENDEYAENEYDTNDELPPIPSRPRSEVISYGGNSEEINFYTIRCSSKEPCTSLIPTQEKIRFVEPKEKRTPAEIKEYLERYNLGRGFHYTGDENKDKNSVVGKFIETINDDLNKHRESRKININRDYYENFWPGHDYKPKTSVHPYPSASTFSAKVIKYETPNTHSRKSPQYYRDRFSSRPIRNTHLELPVPNFEENIQWPYKVPNPSKFYPDPTTTENPYVGGIWNHYATSSIAQFDKKSGDWVQISSSGSDIDSGYFNEKRRPHSPTAFTHNQRPSTLGNTHQTGIGLTVLSENPDYGYDDRYSSGLPLDEIESSKVTNPFDFKTNVYNHRNNHKAVTDNVFKPESSYSSYEDPYSSLIPVPNDQSDIPVYVAPGLYINNKTENFITTPTTTSTTTTTTIKPTTPTPTTPKPAPITPQPSSSTSNSGSGQSPYAMMAAVGAGLIPAAFAALLPAFIAGKRRRKRDTWQPTPSLTSLTFNPLTQNVFSSIHKHSNS